MLRFIELPRHLLSLRAVSVIFFITVFVLPVFAQNGPVYDEQCLLEMLKNGQADQTLGEIRTACALVDPDADKDEKELAAKAETETGVARQRMTAERQAASSPFSILAHKPNYFLVGAYNAEGWDPALYQAASNDPDYQNKDVEGQFQISLKVPLALDLLGDKMDIYGAYTNRSFWQMYNGKYSEPFRETNHEPELWLQFSNDWQVLGLTNVVNTFGYVHQSNGRGEKLSRSWDRLYANFIFEKDDFALSFKPWIWVSVDKTVSDNPDITDYMGHGELRTAWRRGGHVYSMMLRNQLESGFERGALEIGWSFAVFDYPYLKGYLQYFYGYGESLIDYDHKVNRIGIGISMTDWLD